jgi:phospholipid/cholesterol/gamma-HCH transport system permease protein
MSALAAIGRTFLGAASRTVQTAAVIWAVLAQAARRRTWSPPVVNVLSRQILFTAVDSVRFICLLGLIAGVAVVVQLQNWLGKLGQKELLGPLLVTLVVRELGPLLVNFIVIGRSGTAIATEMGIMKARREVEVLDAQGVDPFLYLVVPRVLGAVVSVFSLTLVFVLATLVSGYLMGMAIGVGGMTASAFVDSVLGALSPADVVNFLAKTVIPGLITGSVCCLEGLAVRGAMTEIPIAATRGLTRSISGLFAVSVVVSLLTYG